MDINLVRAVTPVSPSLVSTQNRTNATGSASSGAALASPVAVPATAQPAAQPAASPSTQSGVDPKVQLEAIAKQLQDYLQSSQRDIEFRVDADTGTQVVTVRDGNTGDVIRQMPSEEVLRVMRNLYNAQGSLFNAKV